MCEVYQGYEQKVFDGAADYYASLYDSVGIARPKMDYVTRFSEILENYNPRDEVSVDETRTEVLNNFLGYLREDSIDPADIEDLLGPEDIMRLTPYFKKVRDYKPTLKTILRKYKSKNAILKNWDPLRKAGLSISFLLRIYASRPMEFPDSVTFLIKEKHVPATTAFVHIKDKLFKQKEDNLLASLKILHDAGLSSDIIRDYTPKATRACKVMAKKDEWDDFIDPAALLDKYINEYASGEYNITYRDLLEDIGNLEMLNDTQKKKLFTDLDFLEDRKRFEDLCDWNYSIANEALQYASIDEITTSIEKCLQRHNNNIIAYDLGLAVALYINGAKLSFHKLMRAIQESEEYGEYYGAIACFRGFGADTVRRTLRKYYNSEANWDAFEYVCDLYERRGKVLDKGEHYRVYDLLEKYENEWITNFMYGCRMYHDYVVSE